MRLNGSTQRERQHIERIELGNNGFTANASFLQIDSFADVSSVLDAGATRLTIQGSANDAVLLKDSLHFNKVGAAEENFAHFDIYQAAGSDIQLWLQQGLSVNSHA